MYMQVFLVSPILTPVPKYRYSPVLIVHSAVVPKDKLVINRVLILIAERDRRHKSSYRHTINRASCVGHGKNMYIIFFCNGLNAALPSLFISNYCTAICLYIHPSPTMSSKRIKLYRCCSVVKSVLYIRIFFR